ncbi:hypothetical protein A5648_05870 [Mycolicibacter sinensis]|uniref:Uncharacterized protein n=2 Tax=Mycolicibacter sinensis (strain JDM601) TaxID=875328 RepID=A0A1A3TUM8_MYCSD|nr:hypothetical protein A5648_05870 [Mycolicibacter sinensis]
MQMLDHLYDKLMIDEQWSVRRERGFTWWGYRLAQHIEVSPPIRSHDLDVCIVRIWTEVARDVDPATDPAELLAAVNMQSTMSALVWDPKTATITECCTAVVHAENAAWLWKILMTAAVLQNTAAHSRAHAIADACGGTPAASNHPTSGERPELDDMLNSPEHVIAPVGAEESRFTGALAEGLGKFAWEMGWYGSSDETGIVCEVPYTGNRPLILQDAHAPDTARETALVRIFTDQPHPEFGNGALVLMQLPVNPGAEESTKLANRLNIIESHGDLSTPLLGAWCPDMSREDHDGLAFCSFLPNVLARPGLLENQIVYQAARAQFALRQLQN